MSTRRRPATEDKLEALHYQLIEAVADLATFDGWQRMLSVAARFHAYSGGGVGVFEAQECRPGTRSPGSWSIWVATGRRGSPAANICTDAQTWSCLLYTSPS